MAFYGGLKPHGKVLHTKVWPVVTAVGTALYKGDPVQVVNDGTVAIASVGGSTYGVGAILALFDEKWNPINYIAASRVGDGTYAGYVLVADDPDQEFVIAEDADSDPLALADVHLNASLVAGSGSTETGLSGWLIDSSTANTTNTLQYRIVDIAPYVGNTVYNATTCPNPKWIVKNLYHQHNNILGI